MTIPTLNLKRPLDQISVDSISIESSNELEIHLEQLYKKDGLLILKLNISSDAPQSPQPVSLKWKIPAHNVKGVWHSSSLYEKRLKADWELTPYESRVSVNSPVLCLFGHDDSNCFTFASSDAVHALNFDAKLREEDSFIYCHITFFEEPHSKILEYSCELRFDSRPVMYNKALNDVSKWWEDHDDLRPTLVPSSAFLPVYSTWYSYHQDLSVEKLLGECKLARDMGYGTIIIDDGWQTIDNNRGYDYTGDWQAVRIKDMSSFVAQVHDLGMKFLVWYSVPFCGKKSRAYQKFKGKFLTENHRWAPVFDPRYPEVRQYLIGVYASALKEWNLDGFKLDFIDDFKAYPETVLTAENGRDYASVNEATDKLLEGVIAELKSIKADVLIEFRQNYVGPAMRKYGNMFRAFDCPNDSQTNRIRTTDVRLLAGNSAVHSDMFTWHYDEPVEVAALQFLNVLFTVPQVSVRLDELNSDHRRMLKFLTTYWVKNKDVLQSSCFHPSRPQANYPVLRGETENKCIISVYEDYFVKVSGHTDIDIVNAKLSNNVVVMIAGEDENYDATIYNCLGDPIRKEPITLSTKAQVINIPSSGIAQLKLKSG